MLRLLILLGLLLGVSSATLTPAYGREQLDDEKEEASQNDNSSKTKKNSKKSKRRVADAFAELNFITETQPDLKAKFYIYLCSASWCGPCNKEMPDVVQAYADMRKQGKVELILVSYDRTQDAAKAFLKKFKAELPTVMGSDISADNLPGYEKVSGIPAAIFVNAKGETITSGHGSMISQWEDVVKSKKAKKKERNKKGGNSSL